LYATRLWDIASAAPEYKVELTTFMVAVTVPPDVVKDTIVVPASNAVTYPFEFTVALVGSVEAQVPVVVEGAK
jgi:hypothetical protein